MSVLADRPREWSRHDRFHRMENLILGYGKARAERDTAGALLLMNAIHTELRHIIYEEKEHV